MYTVINLIKKNTNTNGKTLTLSPVMTCGWDIRGLYFFFHIVKLYYDTRMLLRVSGAATWLVRCEATRGNANYLFL